MKDYKKVIPPRFQDVSFEVDVPELIKKACIEQLKDKKGLLLVGETGVGKTHIACALIREFIEKGHEVRFYNTGKFLELLRSEFNDSSESIGLFQEVMDYDGVLFFDDLGAEKPSAWAIERLYLIINEKYEQMRPMFFTTNCSKENLVQTLGDRIVSRITAMTLQIKISGTDRRKQ